MPVPPGTRYRVKRFPSGKQVRLAFKGEKVIEATKLKSKRLKRDAIARALKKGT